MKADMLTRTVWRGILGIIYEIFLVLLFMLLGLMICLAWWKVIK
jgi:hypothetical protein